MCEQTTITCEDSLPITQKVELARNATLSDTIAHACAQDNDKSPPSGSGQFERYQLQHQYILWVGLDAALTVESVAATYQHEMTAAAVAAETTRILMAEAVTRREAYLQFFLSNGVGYPINPSDLKTGKVPQRQLERFFGVCRQEEQHLYDLSFSNICAFPDLSGANCGQAVIDTTKLLLPRQLQTEEEILHQGLIARAAEAVNKHRIHCFGYRSLRGYFQRRRGIIVPAPTA